MLTEKDIDAFAEELIIRYGELADVQALKRANVLAQAGDTQNSEVWFRIRERLIELRVPHAHQ